MEILHARDQTTPQDMGPETEKKDPRAWEALTPPLAEWILDAVASMGFARMTPVQASTIGLFTKNKDVVVEVCKVTPFMEDESDVHEGCYR